MRNRRVLSGAGARRRPIGMGMESLIRRARIWLHVERIKVISWLESTR
jgi:hypothetical protein